MEDANLLRFEFGDVSWIDQSSSLMMNSWDREETFDF